MRGLADHYTALKQDFPHEITQYEEFGDVFEPLTSVLRCDICFGGEKFNEIDPATGRQYDWSYIASVLKRYPYMALPSWYQQSQALSAPPPIAETQTALIASLRLASTTLSIDFDAVAWQIIRYNVYLEVPRGPKLSLRTGNWRQLATSIDGALVTLRVVSQLMAEKYRDNSNSGHTLLRAVQCTQSKWFENFTSLDEFTLTNEAIELSRRLAETGDPRSDRDLRCEALYHIMSYKKVKASTILNQMQRAGENRSFQPSMAAQVPALGGQPQLGTRAPGHIEPFPGYVLEGDRRIDQSRAAMILNALHRMVDIYGYLPDHIAVSDLNLTLLMAILHPSFYRASFIELLPTYAGHSERELEEVNLVRIPHRGLASKASFEGFFHVSMGRNTVPPNAEEVVGQILRAVEEGGQGTLDVHDFDISARNYEPLYSDDRALHLVSLLRGIANSRRPYPNISPGERSRIDLRLVDLTLTLYTLVKESDLEHMLGSAANDYGILTRCAGDNEESLYRAGLTRRQGWGLISVDGGLNRSLEWTSTNQSEECFVLLRAVSNHKQSGECAPC
ncbi:hypothetical protein CPC735_029480 [Coccidioides posadasii C735 delta SOWgp]|uniref:Uncharacterized protein n=1 Tax=Coccidioides posadasii (strain C735) TaxID=222929 RepID=C5P4H2_COCP7|nr:hypothetical protein CPC735_029480 [Coccidioides posadasii C735 delta SOWgp]EER27612.1 hypothetical protein CPC735_029480 [Coccidioides posadasii C735 delta SOWgp]|eukprot:XP_003069757.1 hypothetical protein CPC735_029480 [Coccidioides posadasii C735 delta SOWgp]